MHGYVKVFLFIVYKECKISYDEIVKITNKRMETMSRKEKKPETLKQKRTRQYVRIMLGMYLLYTAYGLIREIQKGTGTGNKEFGILMAALFVLDGAALCINGFIKAMKISAQELKEKESAEDEEPDDADVEETSDTEKDDDTAGMTETKEV